MCNSKFLINSHHERKKQKDNFFSLSLSMDVSLSKNNIKGLNSQFSLVTQLREQIKVI